MPINRRTFLTGAGATAGAMFLPIPAFASGSLPPNGSVPVDTYADNVNYALTQNPDHWGELLLGWRDGPTFDNVSPLLTPANIASQYVTESGWYYLPFTDVVYDPGTWLAQRDFTIHVADGSQITAQYCWAADTAQRQWVNFLVGTGHEVYGSTPERLAAPRLWGGYLPVLDNSYTDAAGVRWDRESFATKVPQSDSLISFVHFSVHGTGNTVLRLQFNVDNVDAIGSDGKRLSLKGNYYLVSGTAGSWHAPNFDIPVTLTGGSADIYLAVLNTPLPVRGLALNAATYQQARQATANYWTNVLSGGSSVSVPEPYAMDALRNTLQQNLVMGWQQSIGNGYETADPGFAFVPEVSTSVTVLGEFGFLDLYRKNLQALLGKGQGPDSFPDWEKGIKLQSAAHYYLLSNDADYLYTNLGTFQQYLQTFAAQRSADPNGLLEKERYGSDIPQPVYGIHHQSDAWRGMRDFGLVLQLIGQNQAAEQFLSEAAALRTALLSAIDRSSQTLPDGSLYVPISLLDPSAPPAYPQITATRDGSYWNLIMPYALATGILPPGSAQAKGLLKYILSYGGLFAGLLRFNESGINPPGVCESGPEPPFPPAAAGYDAPGVDEQYLYSLLRALADNGETDRLVLSFYGKLALDLTPHTFIGGEGTTVSPCPDLPDNFRSQWYPPLSANNAVYLKVLREMLVHEDLDDNGLPQVLNITPATPKGWLAPGKRIDTKDLPTLFGPVAFSLVADAQGAVSVTVTPPVYQTGRVKAQKIVVHVRTPDGADQPIEIDPSATAAQTAVVRPRGSLAAAVNEARPTVVLPQRLLYQPGTTVDLQVTVEAIGVGTVTGRLTAAAPAGWSVRPVSFAVPSNGKIAWQSVPVTVAIPANATQGEHQVTFTATPSSGGSGTRTAWIEVGVPSAQSYADLVEASSPVGYWRLGETSGTSAGDSSGHGGTGSYVGNVTLGQPGAIADDPNGAVRLVDGYIEVPNSTWVALTGPFTLEAWVKVITAAQQGIIEKYDSPADNGYLLRTVQANKLFTETLTNGNGNTGPTGPTTVLPGLWHHVVSTFDGTKMTIYLDGKVEASIPDISTPTAGTNSLKLGAAGDNAGNRLTGWLDEVAIYPSALSAAEVKAHYVKGVLGTPKSGRQISP